MVQINDPAWYTAKTFPEMRKYSSNPQPDLTNEVSSKTMRGPLAVLFACVEFSLSLSEVARDFRICSSSGGFQFGLVCWPVVRSRIPMSRIISFGI